jgi:hypothetical protein
MKVSLVFCTGMLRSGSTWSYNVSRLLGQVAARRADAEYWAGYLTLEEAEEFLISNGGRVPGPTIMKVHGLGAKGKHLLESGLARAVCTYRDPRDCVASMMTFTGESFEASMDRIRFALEMAGTYRNDGRTLFIRYEDMLADAPKYIRAIAHHLGIPVSEHVVAQIDGLAGMEKSKEICERLAMQGGTGVAMRDHRIDSQTWLHHNHIQSGKAGRWKDELNPDQVRRMEGEFSPWLTRFGYESATGPSAKGA